MRATRNGQGSDAANTTGVQIVTVEISSPELLDLHNTLKVAVAAQGAGKSIFPIAMVCRYIPGTLPYSGPGAFATFNVGWAAVLAEPSWLLQLPQDLTNGPDIIAGTSLALHDDPALGENQPLLIQLEDAAPVNGNGTERITLVYFVV